MHFTLVHSFIFRQLCQMEHFTRITFNPNMMGGKPCIRGMRVTVGMVVELVAAGYSTDRIVEAYPYLEPEDISEALLYAAWRAEERDISLETA
jgi:uncharacterized protein (DUF433 family)